VVDGLRFSVNQVKEAGRRLRGTIPLPESGKTDEIKEIFDIAHYWRNLHLLPMRSIRRTVQARARALGFDDALTVARLKRMRSIRKKLARQSRHLTQLQDLGGVRCIVDNIRDVSRMVDALQTRSRHIVHDTNDYIEKPRSSGYRSVHIIFKFKAREAQKECEGRRIEVQVRTRLQHAWATAVEVIGTTRGEDMKASQGDIKWLRLFELMASEMADMEGCPPVEGCLGREVRRSELKSLNAELEAYETLNNLRFAFNEVGQNPALRQVKNPLFLISYDNKSREVHVRQYSGVRKSTENYQLSEASGSVNTVLVEADRIEAVRQAFPNYFGDVELFTQCLHFAVEGKDAPQFKRPIRTKMPRRRELVSDPRDILPGPKRKWVDPLKTKRTKHK